MSNIKILAFYQFTNLSSLHEFKSNLYDFCSKKKILGSILLANEGINGTVGGTPKSIDLLLEKLISLLGCESLEHKQSFCDIMPFLRLKIRLKKEIVSMGEPTIDPKKRVGKYVGALDWNDFIKRDDVVTLDTRNEYEVSVGTFPGSINPETSRFRDFPDWWKKNAHKYKGKKIALFCTGGIRCEKATSYLLQESHQEVYQLKGGILNYLEYIPKSENNFHGECFVFDQRVSVKHNVIPGTFELCFACRRPVSQQSKLSELYEEGVSCEKCYDQHSAKRREGFRERQKQFLLRNVDK